MKMKLARYWVAVGEDEVRCLLCPHRCLIKQGQKGFCHARMNLGGSLYSLTYGNICVSNIDSIEKKPVYHYKPGSKLLSLGTFGCNMDCKNCQNYFLARSSGEDLEYRNSDPDDVVIEALEKDVDGIAWTFNEPIVWCEFLLDVALGARNAGLFSLINTNGFIDKEARADLFNLIDVANIDVKGFSEKFYREICNASLNDVLETCLAAKDSSVHLELTYLLIPGLNDSEEEIVEFSKWVFSNLGSTTPIHFFRFQPSYKLSHLPAQKFEKLLEACNIARECGIEYTYIGGAVGSKHQNTYCPVCGALLIRRESVNPSKVCVRNSEISRFCPDFAKIEMHLEDGCCPSCNHPIPIILI
ncbi:MAG: AmmeMemoRadiSam system radical SAM enzyme [Methanomassiliicoccales archaeon]